MNKRDIADDFAKSLDDPNVEKIILFGSVAKGNSTKESDIDLLIISNNKHKTRDKVMDKVTEFLLENNTYISVKVITPRELEELKNTHFISTVKNEGVKIGR